MIDREKKDTEIAEQIRSKLGQNPDVERITVTGQLLQMHVTESLFNRLATDRERGRKIVITLMENMKQLTGVQDVTVWIYCNNEKVVEGKVKDWGGNNVKYFYDL